MKRRENILRLDSFGLIPEVKGLRLLDAGFFYQMKIVENTDRVAEKIEADPSWDFQDQIFKPLTPDAIARQLRVVQARWFNRKDSDFDLEDEYEEWLFDVLINAIDAGGLTL
ncbi:MAG: hypothetical protein NTZ94_05960 [Verrucomicrobia bacterium]|nr:hypothetical protein [Verrucomicrobiota bacterium]